MGCEGATQSYLGQRLQPYSPTARGWRKPPRAPVLRAARKLPHTTVLRAPRSLSNVQFAVPKTGTYLVPNFGADYVVDFGTSRYQALERNPFPFLVPKLRSCYDFNITVISGTTNGNGVGSKFGYQMCFNFCTSRHRDWELVESKIGNARSPNVQFVMPKTRTDLVLNFCAEHVPNFGTSRYQDLEPKSVTAFGTEDLLILES